MVIQVRGFGADAAPGYSDKLMELCEQAKLLYDFSPLSRMTLLNFGSSAEFLVEDRRNGFYTLLRISGPGTRSRQEVESELSWLHELAHHSLPFAFPEVIPGLDGREVQQIRSPKGGICTCVLFTYLRGRPISMDGEPVAPADATRLGEAAALLHQNAIQWDAAPSLTRWSWDFEALLGANPRYGRWNREGEGIGLPSPAQRALFDEAASAVSLRLRKFGCSPARFGLIHASLAAPNVFYYRNRLAITGFDSCGFGWFLYDFAVFAAAEDDAQCLSLAEAWLLGYGRQRHLSGEDRREIPTFLTMRRLVTLCRALNGFENGADATGLAEKTAVQAQRYLKYVKENL